MSRVFVSCAYRDRATGGRVVELLHELGHDAVDDRGDATGMNWWSEVVRRIEASDVFVAVASPSYAAAQSCRLAAKHAAGCHLRILRLDLVDPEDRTSVDQCHPAVAEAEAVPFHPDDPEARSLLAHLLGDAGRAEPARDPSAPEAVTRRLRRPGLLEVLVAAVVLLAAAALVAFALQDGPTSGGEARTSSATSASPSAPAPGPASASTAPDPEPTEPGEGPDPLAAVSAAAEESPGFALPPTSCRPEDGALTCDDPAADIDTVVLRSYPTRQTLYSAYSDAVADLAGGPVPENTGNCSAVEAEGEVGWNRDRQHVRGYPVAEQVLGGLDPVSESAGRLFCTASGGTTQLVWTQDPYLLATVGGGRRDVVIAWWSDVHLGLACAGGATGKGCGS